MNKQMIFAMMLAAMASLSSCRFTLEPDMYHPGEVNVGVAPAMLNTAKDPQTGKHDAMDAKVATANMCAKPLAVQPIGK